MVGTKWWMTTWGQMPNHPTRDTVNFRRLSGGNLPELLPEHFRPGPGTNSCDFGIPMVHLDWMF